MKHTKKKIKRSAKKLRKKHIKTTKSFDLASFMNTVVLGGAFLLTVISIPNIVYKGQSSLAEIINKDAHNIKVKRISKMIHSLAHNVKAERKLALAESLLKASIKHKIRPEVMISIIDTESDFRRFIKSYTGDVTLAQINPAIWNVEFKRLKREPLDLEKLHKDEDYAIDRMAEILSIIKARYIKKDKFWFARYHSNTPKLRLLYLVKVRSRMEVAQHAKKHFVGQHEASVKEMLVTMNYLNAIQ